MIEEQIFTALAPLFEGRVYPLLAPQDTPRPNLVYQVISDTPNTVLAGRTNTHHLRLQLSIWTDDYLSGKQFAKQAIEALEQAGLRPVIQSIVDDLESATRLCRQIVDVSTWCLFKMESLPSGE
ncbi:DUF3168 domain-containing protein [Jeongeupia chitinilytica]|uniref:DUF3168 domain-containing protein n=1 Tax=Jeongeupia chitinilytica TaxID=1041641 RepID=A0ABQ3GX72_9NEIS|nr:DUF3168 domain-containing protein [Jeongeupia chitinilytica]GHD59504.1 hypothetical protein GCM10007350_11080 [Jeongeupia chitinilytica]